MKSFKLQLENTYLKNEINLKMAGRKTDAGNKT